MQGLDASQVLKSRQEHGANKLARRKRIPVWKSFLANFNDPMLKILLVALAINCIFMFQGEGVLETIGISLAILIAVIVSTISEQSSSAAFEKLQAVVEGITIRCIRSGKVTEIPIEDIVVGDIILLGSGDKIPADGIIIDGQIEVDQSLLNGESKEAVKSLSVNTGKTESGSKTLDFLDSSLLFSGTVVTNGTATMRVTSVGENTAFGKMASELGVEQPKSPLKIKLERLAKLISIVGYIGAVMVAAAYLINVLAINGESFSFRHAVNAATLVVAVIVMAVPEGLPMMIAVVLSSNMKHMMKDNVLVRKLNGIETAGSMNILFTDKTGTLTQGKLEVAQVLTDNMRALATVLRYNNSSIMNTDTKRAIGGNFTDRILLEYSQGLDCESVVVKEQIPFNSKDKFMKTILTDGRTLLKGAPEVILEMCKAVNKAVILKQIDDLTKQAFRLIAVAIDNTYVGLVAIRDNVRPEAKTAVMQLQSAGIQTVMITGDAKETAIAIAREVGIMGTSDVVLTSQELNKLSDAELEKILPRLRVVARALPTDKSRLVRIAQSIGLVAGMTGDGVNDAPALKLADVGFSMGTGTEVAKEAGDIVIMDDNISSIGKATAYGRTIFKSIRKFLIFKLTINFVAMGISILAPFIGVGMPITVLQMLWINIVMDTLAGLAYGGERPQKAYMKEPPKRRDEPIINRYMWGQILYSTIFIAGLSIWFMMSPIIQNSIGIHGAIYSMTAFFAFFMFINIFNSFNSRTHDVNPLSYMSLNKPFIFIMILCTVAQVFLIYFGGNVFRTQPLDLVHFVVVILLAATIFPVDMLRKLFIKWRYGNKIVNT